MLVGSGDGYPLGLIRAASNRTLLRPCRVIMEGFGDVILELSNVIPSEGEQQGVDVCAGKDCEWHADDLVRAIQGQMLCNAILGTL